MTDQEKTWSFNFDPRMFVFGIDVGDDYIDFMLLCFIWTKRRNKK